MKAWLTVKEASVLVGRHQSRVYRWVESGMLRSRTAADGTIEVSSADAARVESVTRRGRPRGSAGRR
jgi:excisionase family DNA binding protein